MSESVRTPVGIWSELGAGSRWVNEGVSRVIGFVIEGAAKSDKYIFHVVVQHGLAETVRADLRTLKAVEGKDWLVSEPDPQAYEYYLDDPRLTDVPARERQMAAAALYCNDHVPVDGWFVSFPFFTGAIHLSGPKATLMPDALGYDFPIGWSAHDWSDDGSQVTWRRQSTRVLAASDTAITFSRHVAERHVVPLLNVAPEKIKVVPLAPPDLANLLPFVENRRQTSDSRTKAAEMLRLYVARRGIDYLQDFPFEETPFVVTATQDRITKNLGAIAEAMRRIVRERRQNMKFLTTANIEFDANWTFLPKVVAQDQVNRDIVSLRDVPREIHAAMLHGATVTVHPTFFEGIIGALPFYESLSVGTPCIMARGPHIDELLEAEPGLEPFVFDPYDIGRLTDLILEVRDNRSEMVEAQLPIFERLSLYGWEQVADAYAQAAITSSDLAVA